MKSLFLRVFKRFDRTIDSILLIILSAWLVYGLWALYDTYRVYEQAGTKKLFKYKPEANGKTLPPEAFDELIKINGDVVAWISIDGTNIDYPIVQGEDNWEYLDKDFKGEYSITGCPFIDVNNNNDLTDDYSVVYGHHVEHGMMFGDLDKFTSTLHFKTHSSGKLYTRAGEVIEVEWIACCFASAYEDPLFTPINHNEENRASLYKAIKQFAIQKTDDIEKKLNGERLFGFSTCSGDGGDMRIILIGKEAGENAY